MKKIYLLSLIPIIWFILHSIVITFYGLSDNSEKADFAIILGNTVNSDGSPSDRLKARLDRAIELFNNSQSKVFLVSGGIGTEGYDEASAMKDYLIAHHVPEEIIFLDSLGNNTLLSAQHSYNFANERNLGSVIIVSQYFHIARAVLIFRRSGFTHNEIFSAHAKYFELRDFYSLFREFFAFYYYFFAI